MTKKLVGTELANHVVGVVSGVKATDTKIEAALKAYNTAAEVFGADHPSVRKMKAHDRGGQGQGSPVMTYFTPTPERCDVCGDALRSVMYDARTTFGPWGNLCSVCFAKVGVGLGTGLGQRYERQTDGRFLKTDG